jgi:hypothetical protein
LLVAGFSTIELLFGRSNGSQKANRVLFAVVGLFALHGSLLQSLTQIIQYAKHETLFLVTNSRKK